VQLFLTARVEHQLCSSTSFVVCNADCEVMYLQVVRYLYEDGAEVGANQPYVECEAMKMIMQLRTTEAGKIKNAMQTGSIIGAGDLLATMQLKDPSKVKKILPFTGSIGEVVAEDLSPLDEINLVLDGFQVLIVHSCLSSASVKRSVSCVRAHL
jgi:hypothetical protein